MAQRTATTAQEAARVSEGEAGTLNVFLSMISGDNMCSVLQGPQFPEHLFSS